MEFEVHRLRIGNVKPSQITSLAADFPSSSKVAVGRDNGTIEIMDSKSNFTVLCRIGGYDSFELQALQWSRASTEDNKNQNRLFGLSRRGFLFEVDFERSMISSKLVDCYSSAAWCLSGCPRRDELAVGGEDGAVKLFTYETENRLEYLKTLPTTGSRILALSYHPSKPLLVVGGEDGVIRGLQEVTGRNTFRLTSHSPSFSSLSSITALICLPGVSENLLVSGDGLGRVRVWDLDKGVSTNEFTTSDGGAITSLATHSQSSSMCTAIFAGLQDGRVICLSRAQGESLSWGYSHSQRIGSHAATALLSIAPNAGVGVLLAGGEDGKLSLLGTTADTFHRTRPKDLSWLSPERDQGTSIQRTMVQGRPVLVIAIRAERGIQLWTIPLTQNVDNDDQSKSKSNGNNTPRLSLLLKLKSECHVRAVSLLDHREGDHHKGVLSLFAISGDNTLKAWALHLTPHKGNHQVAIRAVSLLLPECVGHSACLSPVLGTLTIKRDDNNNSSNEGVNLVASYDGASRSVILLSVATSNSENAGLAVDVFGIIPCDLRGVDTESHPGIGSTSNLDFKLHHHVAHLSFNFTSNASIPEERTRAFLAVSSLTGAVSIVDVIERRVCWRLHTPPCNSPIASLKFLSDTLLLICYAQETSGNDCHAAKVAIFDVSRMSLVRCWMSGSDGKTTVPHALRHAVLGMTTLPSNYTFSSNNESDKGKDQGESESVDGGSSKKKKARRSKSSRNTLPTINEEDSTTTTNNDSNNHNGKRSGKIALYSSTQVVFMDLSQPLPAQAKTIGPFPPPILLANSNHNNNNGKEKEEVIRMETSRQHKRRVRFESNHDLNLNRKRKLSESNLNDATEDDNNAVSEKNGSGSGNFCLVDLYRDILHMSFLPPLPSPTSPSETAITTRPQLVVIESPWSRVAESLPDVIDRKRYGT